MPFGALYKTWFTSNFVDDFVFDANDWVYSHTKVYRVAFQIEVNNSKLFACHSFDHMLPGEKLPTELLVWTRLGPLFYTWTSGRFRQVASLCLNSEESAGWYITSSLLGHQCCIERAWNKFLNTSPGYSRHTSQEPQWMESQYIQHTVND
jgi:hypothetical protein